MPKQSPAQTSTQYPDPTKPVVIQKHFHLPSKDWIFFIGFNIIFPIIFVVMYISMTRNSKPSNEKVNIPSYTAVTHAPTASPTPDYAAQWKMYKLIHEDFSFKYPADWTISENNATYFISGPNNFFLSFDVYKTDAYSNFGTNAKYTVLDHVNTGYKNLNLIVSSSTVNNTIKDQSLALSEWTNPKDQPITSWPYYVSKQSDEKVIRWHGYYQTEDCTGGCGIVSMEYDDFINRPEVKTAIKILKTLHY